MQRSLEFPKLGDVSYARLVGDDVRRDSDLFRHFQDLISASEPKYPSIVRWLSQKVAPGIAAGSRAAYVAYRDEKPIATAVLKKGENAKICHLRIAEDLQDGNLGEFFLSMMIVEARQHASRLHFTLPEGLWEQKKAFFESFGFNLLGTAARQYRHGEMELLCSAAIVDVWRETLPKLPKLASIFSFGGNPLSPELLMSLRPRWANAILNGEKRVEVRRKFSEKWINKAACLYATTPQKRMVGTANIASVVCGSPDELWESFGKEIACTRDEFDAYVRGCEHVYAIVLKDVRPFRSQMDIKELSALIGEGLRPPQSYSAIDPRSAWGRASTLAAVVQAPPAV